MTIGREPTSLRARKKDISRLSLPLAALAAERVPAGFEKRCDSQKPVHRDFPEEGEGERNRGAGWRACVMILVKIHFERRRGG